MARAYPTPMGEVLSFPPQRRGPVASGRVPYRFKPKAVSPEAAGFWLEVSSHGPTHDLTRHRPIGVLSEVFLILAGAAALVGATALWIPAPT